MAGGFLLLQRVHATSHHQHKYKRTDLFHAAHVEVVLVRAERLLRIQPRREVVPPLERPAEEARVALGGREAVEGREAEGKELGAFPAEALLAVEEKEVQDCRLDSVCFGRGVFVWVSKRTTRLEAPGRRSVGTTLDTYAHISRYKPTTTHNTNY